jgi:hypothetical protein
LPAIARAVTAPFSTASRGTREGPSTQPRLSPFFETAFSATMPITSIAEGSLQYALQFDDAGADLIKVRFSGVHQRPRI